MLVASLKRGFGVSGRSRQYVNCEERAFWSDDDLGLGSRSDFISGPMIED